MSKIPCLKIGYMMFVLSPKANMSAVLSALQTAQRVEGDYIPGDAGMVYFPEDRPADTTIALEYIDQRQLRSSRPVRSSAPVIVSPPRTLTAGNLLPHSDHAARR